MRKKIILFLRNTFKHRHKWETIYENRYGFPTEQKCKKCGVTRHVDTSQTSLSLHYCWVYSDGGISNPYALGEGLND